MNTFSQIIFPIVGIVMILLAIGAFFLPYGRKIKDAIQTFEGFGLKLQISVITAIILGGVLFCGIGLYLNERSYRKQYEAALEDQKKK